MLRFGAAAVLGRPLLKRRGDMVGDIADEKLRHAAMLSREGTLQKQGLARFGRPCVACVA